jgi:hypothetical protein
MITYELVVVCMEQVTLVLSPHAGQYIIRHKNGVELGIAYREIDGFYVFDPGLERGGYWDEMILLGIAGHLHALNAEWQAQITKDLR